MEQPANRRRSGVILAVMSLAVSAQSGAGIGRTPGHASVSSDGEAIYSIPIGLPPGTNGMTPALSLVYHHRSLGGLLGIGWSLGGLSQITRCRPTIAQDGFTRLVNGTVTDRFCLDGQRLAVMNNLNYHAPGAEYRTEIESYARIRSAPGQTTAAPEHFLVEAADGRTYEYGATPDSRIDGKTVSTGGARAWALNRIRDRSGNVIDYGYVEEIPGASFRIASIRYNSNPGAGVSASHQVSFIYENRPNNEVDTGYVAGTPIRQVLRLDRIDILYNGSRLRRYELNYEPALSVGDRSRLTSVQECAAGGSDCLAATTFNWQDGTPGFSAAIAFTAALPQPSSTQGYRLWNTADINGDGRADYIYAVGSAPASATIHYRLGTPDGTIGPDINSGIHCPNGIGMPFDRDGDGRSDLLVASAAGTWTIVPGTASGLGAAIATGISVAQGTRDYRGADINGDGLGDIAWSEVPDFNGNTLAVRVRYALRTGGFGSPVTLYRQEEATAYTEPQGGAFMGRPGRPIDLDGDGAEDLMMDENFTIARISHAGYGSFLFDGSFVSGVAFDFNDDDCADYAYKHSTGRLRVRVGCGLSWSGSELLGPAVAGSTLLAHDWNGDGREDLMLRGTANWQVVVSNGDSLAAPVDTGVPHDGSTAEISLDADGDGLQDLFNRAGGRFTLRLKNGSKADLMREAADGFGVGAEFSYSPLTDASIYTRGTGAVYPDQDMQTPAQVVAKLIATDASGRGSRNSFAFRYEGLRRHLLGRGSLGFAKRVVSDLTPEHRLSTEETRRHDYPFTGLPLSVTVRQASGKPVRVTTYQWNSLSLSAALTQRRFPYPATITSRHYEMGDVLDGTEIASVARSVAAIDANSGLVTDQTTTVTEVGGGIHGGASASVRVLHTGVLNDTTHWCNGKPLGTQVTASHTLPGGSAITRTISHSWDGPKCRPTQHRVEPDDSQWQVAYNLTYDPFGNLAGESIVGAGMPARTMGLNWGDRGQFPIRIGDPLAQMTRMSWDAATGRQLTFTDPNGLVLRWAYDAFGQPTSETQPDATSTHWTRVACKSGCDARAKYRLTQEDRDKNGVVLVTATVEVDQHGRGFKLFTQQPGGGRVISSVDSNDRGQTLRRYLPYWEGDTPAGYWHFEYDAIDRPTAAKLMAINGVPERSIELEYGGHSITRKDLLGRRTTGTRTAWGQLSEVMDAAGGTARYEYDALGNLLRTRDAMNNLVATIGYNARGMKLSHGDMDMGSWAWTRNSLGETTSFRDAKGQIIQFEYDKLGRITRRAAPDGTSQWLWGNTAAKKDVGRLVSVSGPGYAENFTYDGVGRPATRTIVTDASYRFDYLYDASGLLTTISYPSAGPGNPFKLHYEYDAGRISRIRNAFAPGEAYWNLNAQDAAGHVIDESLGAAIRVVTGFHPVTGEIEYRQAGVGGNAAIQNLAYAWDAGGNLTRRKDLNKSHVEEFRYDALDRLDESRRNGVSNLELDYDAIGNIRRKSDVCTGATACYAYHATRKHAVTSAGGLSYGYDANGNMTSRGGASIGWTSNNLPKSIAHSNGNFSQFAYGPDGNRWRQIAKYGATTETTHYASELLERVTRGSAMTWRHYLLAPTGEIGVQQRFSDGSPPVMRYLTQDHLGSIDRILDDAGNLIVSESYATFGRRRGTNWTGVPSAADLAKIGAVTRDGFTGHEHLDNLDLIHMNGRVYDPHLGRFISADPYVTAPYDGQGLNRYAYAGNNPLAFVDPTGFDDETPCMESSPGVCAQVTVIGMSWADYIRATGGAGAAQVASAMERDPCGQESNAFTCAMQTGHLVSPASIVLTVGTLVDSTLSGNRELDYAQGIVARVGNLVMGSSPVAILFGADPDFEWFNIPDNDAGRAGARFGNIGYFAGGFAGMVRKSGSEIIGGAASQFARSLQGTSKYPGVDRFKDITLKKGTIIYAGFPGQGAFYTTASALRRASGSAASLFDGLQVARHATRPPRARVAAFEVIEDTRVAFGLAIANSTHGAGWLPQIVVPSFQSNLRYVADFPLGP